MRCITLFLLVIGVFCSCEKTTIKDPLTAVILAHTCGGTIIKFSSTEVGEEWINNFDDGQIYTNVALTNDLEVEGYQKGDSIQFNFIKVNKLEGNFCDIGGLPETKVHLSNLIKIK